MKLTLFTDYALRSLIYLSLHTGRLVSATEIAEAYGISGDHVRKVTKALVASGHLASKRGRGGGLRLAVDPQEVALGQLVRELEPDSGLLACFDDPNACRLTPACRLKGALAEAERAFYDSLDRFTLADLARNRAQLRRILPSAQ